MNRLRLWGYVVLLLVVGLGNLYFVSGWIGARSLAQLDRDLRASATLLEARTRLAAADAGALAEAAARSPAVVAGLAEAQLDPLVAAAEAIRPAAEALKVDPKTLLVGAAGSRGAAARVAGQPVALPDGASFVADPQRGVRRDGYVRAGDKVWTVAGVPAGRGAATLAGLPLDAGFAAGLHAASGVEVTLLLDGKPAVTSARPGAPRELASAGALPPRRVTDLGSLGAVKGFLPLPALPLLFVSAPEARAYAVPLEGAPGAVVVLSSPAAPQLVGLATYQAATLVVLAALLLIGIVLGLLMREEGGRAIPRELLQAADRVNRGDFTARAPVLAGSAGVLANALNRAAEAAETWAPPSTAPAPATTETGTQPIFSPPASPAPAVPAAAPAPAPARSWEPEQTAAWTASPAEAPAPAALGGAAVEPVPAEPPAAEAPPAEPIPPAPEPPPGVVPELPPPPPPEPAASAAPPPPEPAPAAPAASLAEEEESHWRMVFDDFVRVRGETGEASSAVSFERFRTKLQRNRDQLVEKYGCRTVRFQVYVKEGKAAVRATPVR